MSHDGTFIGAMYDAHDPLKRILDITVSLVLIVILAPILLATFILVKLSSPGPAIFIQRRYGLGGKPFACYKFRTMYAYKGGEGFKQCMKGDPRVTPIGRILRSSSLDELPQLFNVLFGSMSLVGPRPHPLTLDDEFSPRIDGYQSRFLVKPGITGLAQISGSRGPTPTLRDMQRRIEADQSYIRHRSIILDLGILCATIPCVVKGTNAF